MLSLSVHTRNCLIGPTPTSGVTYFNELLHCRHINSKKNCSRNPTAHLPSRKRAEREDRAEVHSLLPNPHLGGASVRKRSRSLCVLVFEVTNVQFPPVGFPLVSRRRGERARRQRSWARPRDVWSSGNRTVGVWVRGCFRQEGLLRCPPRGSLATPERERQPWLSQVAQGNRPRERISEMSAVSLFGTGSPGDSSDSSVLEKYQTLQGQCHAQGLAPGKPSCVICVNDIATTRAHETHTVSILLTLCRLMLPVSPLLLGHVCPPPTVRHLSLTSLAGLWHTVPVEDGLT